MQRDAHPDCAGRQRRGRTLQPRPLGGAGANVPQDLRGRWHLVFDKGTQWLERQPDGSFDVLFEDMVHGADDTRDWWRVALRKLKPGGVLLSHDAAHPGAGADVRRGIQMAGITPMILDIAPSDCGFALYVDPRPREVAAPEPEAQPESGAPKRAAKARATTRKPSTKRTTTKK
jgi:Methyltransferase domain